MATGLVTGLAPREGRGVSEQFAGMVGAAMRAKGWNPYQLSAAIGLLPSGRVFHSKQVDRLLDGSRKSLNRELVDRLVEVLDLDPYEAYEAADLRPAGFSAEDHRDFAAVGGRATADQPKTVTGWSSVPPGLRVRPAGRRAGRWPLVSHGYASIGH
jgi:hypothetical protein